MSLALIRAQIDEFLKTDTPEILALKGSWGVGKTFLWNKQVAAAQEARTVALKRYVYVSLFGINSLDDLRMAIFAESESAKHSESGHTFTPLEKMKDAYTWARKKTGVFKDVSYVKNFWSIVQAVAYATINKTLICIDDVERKGKDLSPTEVLGLVTKLKEQKACKIVLIFNEEKLQKEDEFAKLREKAIDIELELKPTPHEAANLALPNDPVSNELARYTQLLEINNIRMIHKIARLAGIVCALLKDYEQGTINRILHSLTLFAWSHFSDPGKAPDHDFILNSNPMKSLWTAANKETGIEGNKEEEKWNSMLLQYDFIACDELDLQIASIVKCGYVDREAFLAEAKKLDQRVISDQSKSSFNQVWQSIHDSFDDNETEFLEKLRKATEQNLKYLEPLELHDVVQTLRAFERDECADELIEEFIRVRSNEPAVFAIRKGHFFNRFSDAKLIDMFDKVNWQQQRPTTKSVLDRIAGQDGWNPEDERILAAATPAIYYEIFKSEHGEKLTSYLACLLRFDRYTPQTPEMSAIVSNVKAALKQIAGENRLNKYRVRHYGIELE